MSQTISKSQFAVALAALSATGLLASAASADLIVEVSSTHSPGSIGALEAEALEEKGDKPPEKKGDKPPVKKGDKKDNKKQKDGGGKGGCGAGTCG